MATYQRSIPIPGKSADEIYSRIEKALEKFEAGDTGKFGKFEFKRDAGAKTVRLESSQVTANLKCTDGSVLLEGRLSFLASAFRGKIDGWIDQWIGRAFANSDHNNPV
jgi:hypothetical protein